MAPSNTVGRFLGLSFVASSALLANAQSSFVPLAAKTFDYVSLLSCMNMITRRHLRISLTHLHAISILGKQPDGIPYRVDTDSGPRGTQQGYNVSPRPLGYRYPVFGRPAALQSLLYCCCRLPKDAHTSNAKIISFDGLISLSFYTRINTHCIHVATTKPTATSTLLDMKHLRTISSLFAFWNDSYVTPLPKVKNHYARPVSSTASRTSV